MSGDKLDFQEFGFPTDTRSCARSGTTISDNSELVAADPTIMAKQHQWAERNATRQAYYGMPGLYKGEWKKPQMFPYGPEPSDFDTYGQYFWFYAGWYIIWLSTIAAAVIIILDLVLYVNHEGDPDKRVLALSIVPVSRASGSPNSSRVRVSAFTVANSGESTSECHSAHLDDDRWNSAKEDLAEREAWR